MLLGREAELLFEPIPDVGLKLEASAIKRLSLKKAAFGEFQFRRSKSAADPLSQRFSRRAFASLLAHKSDNANPRGKDVRPY